MASGRIFFALLLMTSLTAKAAEVSNLRVWTDPDKTRAVLDLSEPAEYQLFTLQNPNRVVIDLQAAKLNKSFKPESIQSGVINSVRHGKPESGTLRIVLDLNDQANCQAHKYGSYYECSYSHKAKIEKIVLRRNKKPGLSPWFST